MEYWLTLFYRLQLKTYISGFFEINHLLPLLRWIGFISCSVYRSEYICLRIFLFYQLSVVSEKLWFSCSVSVWVASSTSISYSAARVPYLSINLITRLATPTIWDASTTFPTASFIIGAAPRVSAMLAVCYLSCM